MKWKEAVRRHGFTVLVVGAAFAYLAFFQRSGACPATLFGNWLAGGASVPAQAPAWQAQRLEGGTLSSQDLAGKVVVLNFWATWCGPCVAELPDLVDAHQQFAQQGVQIVGATIESTTDAEKIRAFVDHRALPYPIVYADSALIDGFGGVDAVPTTLVIAPDGRILDRHVGILSTQKLQKLIESARSSLPQS